ncbi:MAG: membrane protein [Candidatus Poriferisodalaceae bacterium]
MPSLKELLLEVKDQVKQDNVPVSAAGIAFFGFFALFPALGALIAVYGMVADPAEVPTQLNETLAGAPEGLREFIVEEATSIAESSGGALGFGVAVGILIAIWSASGAIKHLLAALNRVYGFRETRGFASLRGASYSFTLGTVLALALAMFGLAVLPGLLAALDMGPFGRVVIGILRFPGLVLFMAICLSILYHLGPDRPTRGKFRWVTKGSMIATVMWIVLCGLLSIYITASTSGDASPTAALLAVLTSLMLFLNVTALCVLIGAEIDATIEMMERRERAADEEKVTAAMTRSGKATISGALLGTAIGVVLGRPKK